MKIFLLEIVILLLDSYHFLFVLTCLSWIHEIMLSNITLIFNITVKHIITTLLSRSMIDDWSPIIILLIIPKTFVLAWPRHQRSFSIKHHHELSYKVVNVEILINAKMEKEDEKRSCEMSLPATSLHDIVHSCKRYINSILIIDFS